MIPANCHLWKKKDLTPADVDLNRHFMQVRRYEEESHLNRGLYCCSSCGQLYFYEFYEEIDWEQGQDPQYRTWIPVADEAEAAVLSMLPSIELLRFVPRIQSDWPVDADAPVVRWVFH